MAGHGCLNSLSQPLSNPDGDTVPVFMSLGTAMPGDWPRENAHLSHAQYVHQHGGTKGFKLTGANKSSNYFFHQIPSLVAGSESAKSDFNHRRNTLDGQLPISHQLVGGSPNINSTSTIPDGASRGLCPPQTTAGLSERMTSPASRAKAKRNKNQVLASNRLTDRPSHKIPATTIVANQVVSLGCL